MGADMDNPESNGWLLAHWREDLLANRRRLFGAGFHALAVYRLGVWSRHKSGLKGWLTRRIYRIVYTFVSNFYGVELPKGAVVGRRLWLPHAVGVVVSTRAQIGDDCMIRQNVTIGQFNAGRTRAPEFAPKLGNGVRVGAGAVIVGGVTIGDNASIGPNAVVVTDVPAGGAAYARSAGVLSDLHGRDHGAGVTTAHESPEDEAETELPGLGGIPAMGEFVELIHSVIDPGEPVDAETPLISTGIIDSFDVVALLSAIESRYGVEIRSEQVDVESFDTPSQMLVLVKAIRG